LFTFLIKGRARNVLIFLRVKIKEYIGIFNIFKINLINNEWRANNMLVFLTVKSKQYVVIYKSANEREICCYPWCIVRSMLVFLVQSEKYVSIPSVE
jgi:hypothetical protein